MVDLAALGECTACNSACSLSPFFLSVNSCHVLLPGPTLVPTYSQQSQAKESSQAPQMDVGGEEVGGGGVGGGGGGGDGDVAARYERDLVHKLKLLRHELSLQQPQAGHCRIEVSREEIFEVGANVRPGRK